MRLLAGTRKGAFILDAYTVRGPYLLGSMIHHMVMDPRDGRTLLMGARTGHLGPTVFRSTDDGGTWKEAVRPPAFANVPDGPVVDHVFWLTPGHADEPGVWWAGTSPPGLFRSTDGGITWEGVDGFNLNPQRTVWVGDGTPDGPKLHSILIDPRDPRHMYLGLSSGGVFESHDRAATWQPLNRGCAADFLPQPDPEFGHDPHCVRLHPLRPDRLYQQNHCGIYRMERPEARWVRVGDNMPREIGDIGFPIVLHPRDPDTAWVFPMDATDVWPRTSPGGRPAVYTTNDAGRSWRRQDRGLPASHAYWTVKRQAMTVDGAGPPAVYFGTTNGEIWGSRDEGESWECVARHLPHIYSLEVA